MSVRGRAAAFFDLSGGTRACWRRTLFPAGALFLCVAAMTFAKTGRDALYFQKDGLLDLPQAYLGIALFSVPFSGMTLGLMRLLGPRRARLAVLLGLAGLLALCSLVVQPGGGPRMTLIFMLVPLAFGVVLSVVWLLGADLLENVPRFLLPRLYSAVGGASMSGGLAAAASGNWLASYLPPAAFFVLAGALLAAAALVVSLGQGCCPPARRLSPAPSQAEEIAAHASARSTPNPIHRRRYLWLLGSVGLLTAVAGVLIEFQFYWSVSESVRDERAFLRFFAAFYTWLNGASLLVQVAVTPFLQRRLGIHGSLLILPAALASGALVLALNASLPIRAGLRVVEGGLKSSVHRSNWEQAYLPLTGPLRLRAKLLVDGLVSYFGQGLAAAALLVWLRFSQELQDPVAESGRGITVALAGACFCWLLLAARLGGTLRALSPNMTELRTKIPVPDGCASTAALGEGLQYQLLRRAATGAESDKVVSGAESGG